MCVPGDVRPDTGTGTVARSGRRPGAGSCRSVGPDYTDPSGTIENAWSSWPEVARRFLPPAGIRVGRQVCSRSVRWTTIPDNGVSCSTGCGAAWLARLTGGQEVAGSNPASPTIEVQVRAGFRKRGPALLLPMYTACQRKFGDVDVERVKARGTGDLHDARAAKAVAALVAVGWAVGPPEDPEGWRADVRAAARLAGKRVRTGTARTEGGDTRPWACGVEDYEALRTAMGGLGMKGLGAILIATEAEWPKRYM